jgi:hypothetical protein
VARMRVEISRHSSGVHPVEREGKWLRVLSRRSRFPRSLSSRLFWHH